ncbi:MAG: rhodanese-like domain-containing protein, partial [Acidobacteria bacterium]|nr:rhodanese-like domain-containing protein [Acidobacteriota bacterium]
LIEHEGGQVVNVLPEPEYTAAHIPGSINIPLKLLNASTTSVLSRGKPVVVH